MTALLFATWWALGYDFHDFESWTVMMVVVGSTTVNMRESIPCVRFATASP